MGALSYSYVNLSKMSCTRNNKVWNLFEMLDIFWKKIKLFLLVNLWWISSEGGEIFFWVKSAKYSFVKSQ